jgi:hypothetical protein
MYIEKQGSYDPTAPNISVLSIFNKDIITLLMQNALVVEKEGWNLYYC